MYKDGEKIDCVFFPFLFVFLAKVSNFILFEALLSSLTINLQPLPTRFEVLPQMRTYYFCEICRLSRWSDEFTNVIVEKKEKKILSILLCCETAEVSFAHVRKYNSSTMILPQASNTLCYLLCTQGDTLNDRTDTAGEARRKASCCCCLIYIKDNWPECKKHDKR